MGKSCGECGMCCKLLGIESISKPPGQWCGHYKRGVGCGVYEDRPVACARFICLWLSSEGLDDTWRPDKSKFVLFTEQEGRRLNIVVDASDPTAWKREPYYSRIKKMSQRALDGYEVLVSVGWRRIVVFPHDDVDLGIIDPEHKIVSGYATQDGQRVPYAMVMSDIEGQAPSP